MSAASSLLQRVVGLGARRMGGRDPQQQFVYDAATPGPSLVAAGPIAQLWIGGSDEALSLYSPS